MADYGMKVSLPGVDVTEATPEQCAMHSGYPSPKIIVGESPEHFGLVRVNFTQDPGTDGTTYTLHTINHGLGYKPAVLGTLFLADGTFDDNPIYSILPWTPSLTVQIWIEADDSDMRIKFWQTFEWIDPGDTAEISFYIFSENGL